MNEQKNIPELRFPEFTGKWEEKKIGEVSEIKTGDKDTQNRVDDGTYPFFVRSDTVERINSYSFDGEAILTSGDGVGVGKNFHYINGKFDFHQRVYSIRKFNRNYSGKFIYYIFSERFYKHVIRLSAKNSVDSVRMDMIKDMSILFPEFPEQQKIASFFTAIDQKISQLKRKKTLLEQYKKGVMQKIFSQEIRFRDDNEQEFPKREKMTGDALFRTVSNKNHNSDLPILAITQEHGAIPRDMIDYYITVSEQSVESYKVVEKGDFIISLRSFQGGIEYSEYTGICSPAYIILRATQRIDHRYFKYYFKTDKYITDLNRKLEGIRDGKMISYKYFSEIEINVPSLPEQTKISNFLSAIDDKITHTQNQIEKAEVWKKGLMQQMFV